MTITGWIPILQKTILTQQKHLFFRTETISLWKNKTFFRTNLLNKTCIKQDKHGPKTVKSTKKPTFLCDRHKCRSVGETWSSRPPPSQVSSPPLQSGGSGVSPPRKFWKSRFNLVHSDAFFCFSWDIFAIFRTSRKFKNQEFQDTCEARVLKFRSFLPFSGQLNISGQIQDINEISGISGISEQLGPLLTTKSTKEKRLPVYKANQKSNTVSF